MKKLTLLFLLVLISKVTGAQEEAKKFRFPINEFRASVNTTAFRDEKTESREGFGVGIYRSGDRNKRVNWIAGLEFNHTRQFRTWFFETQYRYMLNTMYSMNCFSVPVGIRINIGGSTKFFIELGAYFDYLASSRKMGTFQWVLGPVGGVDNEYVDQNAQLGKFNYGFSGGIGTAIPMGKIDLLIKADCKLGVMDLHPNYNEPYYEGKNIQPFYNHYLRLSLGVKF